MIQTVPGILHGAVTSPARSLALGSLLVLAAGLLPATARAQIVVEGISDQAILTDRARFVIPTVPGFTYAATLDAFPVATGRSVEIDAPDYHELRVRRTSLTSPGNPPEERLIRFIVRASERGDSEWGLPPWTPPPVVDASPEELAPSTLRLLIPANFPAGLPIPVVAWLDAPDGHTLRANATLTSKAHPPVQLRRGVGAGSIPAPAASGAWAYEATVPGHTLRSELILEPDPVWKDVGGTLPAGEVSWPDDARVAVTNDLTVAAGTTLSVGAGVIVRLVGGADILVNGTLRIAGTAARPVTWLPADPTQPWGGFVVRGALAQFTATATMFVGSGANARWFDENAGYDVHRREQALLLVDGATAFLRDCAAWDGHGQFGHGKNATLTLERSLIQRFITGGEYNGGSVQIHDSALIEFPLDDGVFDDADNDAIYFTSGRHVVADSLIGWAKDDGIDAGSGGAGSVLATNVWVEGNFHEAFAWSGGGRSATNLHCVALNCGQGIEAGWSTGSDSPAVRADDCLSLGNAVGLRFGDNYDWTYNGTLRVTRSLVLFNRRDVFGLNWDDWTYRRAQIDLQDNWLTVPDPNQPNNRTWSPERDAALLAPFSNVPTSAPPGLALLTRRARQARDVAVGLSRFVPRAVEVEVVVESPTNRLAQATLRFAPGETLKRLPTDLLRSVGVGLVRIRLHSPRDAVFTGPTQWYAPAGAVGPMLPAVVEAVRFGSDIVLVWSDSGFVLEHASDIPGGWAAVAEAVSPWPIPVMDRGFYRLRRR